MCSVLLLLLFGLNTTNMNCNASMINWRARETLSGVTQLKIGDVYLYICLDVRMSFCTLTLAFLC